MTIRKQLEIWQQFNGYLSGVTRIARDNPNVTFDQLYAAMSEQGYFGGWGKEAIRNAFGRGR